jgi:O-antigen/teichoic acid export membrane protein
MRIIKNLYLTQGFKRFFANTSWLMAEKIIRIGISLLVGVYVARYLGPERFGILSYAISFVWLFSALATLGLDGIVVRNLVQNIKDRDRLLGTAFALKLAGGIMLLGCVSIVMQFTSSDTDTKLLILIIAGGMLLQSFQVIDFFFQSQVLGRLSSIAGLWALLLSSLTKLFLIFSQASLIWFAIASVLETGVLGLVLIYFYLKEKVRISRWRFEWDMAGALLRDSWALILSGFVITIYMRIDQIMIKEILDSEAVGTYAAAVRLSEAWYFIPMVVCTSIFPAILNAKKKDEKFYNDRMQSLYNLMTWMGIAIALPTTFISNWIIMWLYGNAYAGAGSVLKVHIWAGVFVFLGVASGKYFLAENLQKFIMLLTLAGGISNVVFNALLLSRYGIVGAAWATFISYAIATYFILPVSPKSRKTFFRMTNSFNFFRIFATGTR